MRGRPPRPDKQRSRQAARLTNTLDRGSYLARADGSKARTGAHAERFDISEHNEESFSPREWAVLTKLADGEADDARWTECPCCNGRAVQFPDDRLGALIVCLALAACGESEIRAAIEEDALEDEDTLQDAADVEDFR